MCPALHRIVRARGRREDDIVFVIRLRDGEEVRGSADDALTVNENTGVLSVHRVEGFEEVTTHYSPSAWAWVTQRVEGDWGPSLGGLLSAGHGFDDTERPCRLHHAPQLEAAPME